MATKMTYAPFREPEGISINKEETEGNGLDKGILLTLDIEQIIEKYNPSASDKKISPQALYKVYLPTGVESETPRTIQLFEKIQHSLSFLSRALDTEDEIERESIMNSFAESIFELTFLPTKSKEFKDAIFLTHTAIEAHKKEIYERREILALRYALDIIKDNLYAGDERLDKCVELLEMAGFDVNAPIGEVELNL